MSIVEVDATNNMYAVLFEELSIGQSNGYALVQVDFNNYRLDVKSFQYQSSGMSIKKILSIDKENFILIIGERKVAEARDVVQTLLIRQNLYTDGDREIVHFDLAVHQALVHPLFDAVQFPIVIL